MEQRHPLLLLLLTATVVVSAFACGAEIPLEPYSSKPTVGEMAFVAQWKQFLLRQGNANAGRYVADLPFSFKCGERSSRQWVRIETAKIASGDWRDDKTRTHVLSWNDVQTALACEMQLTEFQGFPAFQWVVRVRNDGATDSAKLHDFWGIDTAWNAAEGSMPILHRSVGSPGHEGDFHLMSEVMHNSMWDQRRRIPMDTPTNARWGQTHAYHLPADKRSSAHWLPFFNYQTGGDGLISGLGWSGAWRAYFDHPGEGKSTILAGVENLDTILYFLTGTPDGKIRDGQTLLLDLGKPEAFQWAVDVVAGLIDSYDIDWYEEDFNLEARDACEIVIMEKPRLGRTCPAHFPKTRRPVSCTSCSRSRCGSHVQYIHTGAAL